MAQRAGVLFAVRNLAILSMSCGIEKRDEGVGVTMVSLLGQTGGEICMTLDDSSLILRYSRLDPSRFLPTSRRAFMNSVWHESKCPLVGDLLLRPE